ncbi:SMR domain-containing protein isoform X1 [Tanacetum coccineum]
MHGDSVAIIKRRRQDLHRDGVRDPVTASGRGRLKEDLESSTWPTIKLKLDSPLNFAIVGSKRHKSSGSSSFNTESGNASINLNTNVGDNDEDEGIVKLYVKSSQPPHQKDVPNHIVLVLESRKLRIVLLKLQCMISKFLRSAAAVVMNQYSVDKNDPKDVQLQNNDIMYDIASSVEISKFLRSAAAVVMNPYSVDKNNPKDVQLQNNDIMYDIASSVESGAEDEDYINKAMIHYQVETGLPFKFRHCWEVLKDSLKWQEIALPKFSIESSGGSKRHKSSGSSSFNTESGNASIDLNTNVGDNDEDEDKARAAGKNKGSKASGSSTMNDDALARLMVTEMAAQEKEQREIFLEIKRREVECRERELDMKHSKKKKRHRPQQPHVSKPTKSVDSQNPSVDQPKDLDSLSERIVSFTLDDNETNSSSSANRDDYDDAIEIFGSLTETGSSSGSSGTGSSGLSNCGEGFNGRSVGRSGKGNKGRVVAATGMVSSMLGKDYVPTSSRKRGVDKWKGVSNDDAEQFLCSMLSDDCELGMDLVKDVLCQCAYDVEKALDTLLELTAPLSDLSKSGQDQDENASSKDTRSYLECSYDSTDMTSDLASSSDSDLNMGFNSRNYYDVLAGFGTQPAPGPKSTSELTQDVLESLFKTGKSKKHEPSNMNWRNVVKKMESFGEAASAYANGKREYASYLSDQGRQCNEKARQADKRASQDIFNSRNKDFENLITIDLHGQHVKQGMKLLKLHLLFGAYVRSVRLFRVITGCGSHGVGKSKLKQSVINLLESENIDWNEENRGTLLIKLNGQREFSFLDSGSDSE